ncbi:MAG: hypothetical protein J6N70_10695 [Oribacterium sp.]|nr:hypothetical protein [Oribacterium sp.]
MYEDLQEGLRQAIDYTKGTGQARVTVYRTDHETEYKKEQIRQVRADAHSFLPEERAHDSFVISAE